VAINHVAMFYGVYTRFDTQCDIAGANSVGANRLPYAMSLFYGSRDFCSGKAASEMPSKGIHATGDQQLNQIRATSQISPYCLSHFINTIHCIPRPFTAMPVCGRQPPSGNYHSWSDNHTTLHRQLHVNVEEIHLINDSNESNT